MALSLTNAYQYIGRTSAVSTSSGYKYYILLYAKTTGDTATGKHTVTVKMRLACTSNATFYGFSTTGKVTVAGVSAISWSKQDIPAVDWSDSDSLTVDGVTYKRYVDLKTGSVVVDTGYGAAKTVTITASWVSNEASTRGWAPTQGEEATASISVVLPLIAGGEPEVSMELSPVSTLAEKFSGLYIQGKTKVKAEITAEGQYGATIESYSMKVLGVSYGESAEYTSAFLSQYGVLTVYGYATDNRGTTGNTTQIIQVLSYSKPQVLAAEGESEVIAKRCSEDGTHSDNGSYLHIKAVMSCTSIQKDGTECNGCEMFYRIKTGDGSYGELVSLGVGSSGDTVEAVLGLSLAADKSYTVEIVVTDDVGDSGSAAIRIPTETVYVHRNGAKRSWGFGEYIEEENTVSVAEDMTLKVKGELIVKGQGWQSLGLNAAVTEPENLNGHCPGGTGCHWRVENGNHVYIAFNCGLTWTGDTVYINLDTIPEGYRPKRTICHIVTAQGKYIVRFFVSAYGNVAVEWVQSLVSTEVTGVTLTWVAGYIDYFIDE